MVKIASKEGISRKELRDSLSIKDDSLLDTVEKDTKIKIIPDPGGDKEKDKYYLSPDGEKWKKNLENDLMKQKSR